jgi:tetratricopeptide (TPR) repeat protein
VTDLPFRKILGLNQQTYQRLRIALSLNLRRQVFVVVCDDLTLRDRLAHQLIEDLTPAKPQSDYSTSLQRYPRLVSLQLDLNDPNPIGQIAQWLSQSPPLRNGNRRAAMPAFQILGVEQLVRQPAAIQRRLFTHLQGIERSLPVLESSLIVWVTQPWYHALPQSAPEFWRCRTGVFEFIGEPTPLTPSAEKPPVSLPAWPSTTDPSATPAEEETVATLAEPPLPPQSPLPHEDLWKVLARDLARLDSPNPPHPPAEEDGSPSNGNGKPQRTGAGLTQSPSTTGGPTRPRLQPSVTVVGGAASQTLTQSSVQLEVAKTEAESAIATQILKEEASLAAPITTPSYEPNYDLDEQADEIEVATAELTFDSATRLEVGSSQPMALLQQIEALHQQQAPPAALVDIYRALGNWYRDRIEQGDVSIENLKSAIQAYEHVLVWLHETSSLWTDVLNDLGNLYWMTSRHLFAPEQALSYLQQAIQSYQLALGKLNMGTQPYAYPMIQNNLGAAYADLARYQDAAENLQRSIQAYQQALRHRKPEDDPQRYASTQNNLGTTYWNLAQHQQPVVYLKQAIAAYSEALHYYSPQQEPLSYAMIQNNLGTAYWNLAQHERPQDWLRLALGAYQTALRYRTFEAAPVAFAATQNNLGTAYWHLANHAKDQSDLRFDYLQQAIQAYQVTLNATEQLKKTNSSIALNFDLFATHNNLGLAHYQIATDAYISLEAAATFEHLNSALHHHLQALQGWNSNAELRQTALNCVIQTIRMIYENCGLAGQNQALSNLPGHLLPEVLPRL